MRNIIAVPVVWASAVSAQRVGGLCLQKDGITLSGSVISVLRKRDNFRWSVIFFGMTISCPNQTVVSNQAWKETSRSLFFWIGAFCWKEKLNIFLSLSGGKSNTSITCLQTVFLHSWFLWFTGLRTLFTAVIGQSRKYDFWRTLFRYRRQLQ